jgi:hypothetical protein
MEKQHISDTPRFDHPRPDLHRGLVEGRSWVCLNGWWEFDFDPAGEGLTKKWYRGKREYKRRIRVPFPWQSHAAWGTEDQASNSDFFSREAFLEPDKVRGDDESYRGAPQQEIGWYRRTFTAPEGWRDGGKRIFLHIGAADYHVTAWVNGTKVGESESGYLPVSFDVTDALKAGDNVVVLRVYDPMDHKTQPVGKQWWWYTRTSGIWQTVWLEPRATVHTAGLRVFPDRETGMVRIEARIVAGEEASRTRMLVTIGLGGQQIVSAQAGVGELEVGEHVVEIVVAVPTIRPWTPEEPTIYDLGVALQYYGTGGPEQKDEVSTYFGFRDLTVGPLHQGGPAYVRLNDEAVYLRGNLNQSFNPWGVYTFPSDEAIRRDMEQAKESGFNFVRLHIKIEDPRWYYWADRLGLLIMQDMPNFGYDGWCDEALERWERTCRGAMERDFNHPAIIAWCLFNETWGLGGDAYKKDKKRQQWVERMYLTAKGLDPTRLVEDNSACLYDHVRTDINSWHFYINDYAAAAAHIREVVEKTCPGSDFNYAPGRYQGAEPLMNSEYGGIAAGSGDMDVSWCFRFLTNELRLHEKICGYVYTEQMDIEWEHNGFYNYDRTPKQFGYNPSLLQRKQFVGISGPAGREVAAGETAVLTWWLRGPEPSTRARLVVRAQRYNAMAEMDGDWRETIQIGNWEMTRLGEQELALGEALTAHAGVVWVWFELLDEASRVLAGNFAVLEVVGPPGLPEGARVLDLGACTGEFSGGEVEKAEHEGVVQLASGTGAGRLDFDVPLPASVGALTILGELSSRRPGRDVPQTDDDAWPTEVAVKLNEQEVGRLIIGNQYADARGALSHMHELAGRYGEPVRIEVPADTARNLAGTGKLVLRFEAVEKDGHAGGLAVYGPRAGRYPCGLTVVWSR